MRLIEAAWTATIAARDAEITKILGLAELSHVVVVAEGVDRGSYHYGQTTSQLPDLEAIRTITCWAGSGAQVEAVAEVLQRLRSLCSPKPASEDDS